MDNVSYDDQGLKDSTKETRPPPVPSSPQTFDVSEPNSQQRSRRKSYSRLQLLLVVAVTIFATLSSVFMAIYFTDKGKSKACVCQYSNKNMGLEESRNDVEKECKPCDCQNILATTPNTSRNHTEGKSNKPCVCQKILANIKNTSRNHTEEECKPCVYQNCSLATNCSKSKTKSTANRQCPVGCVNSTIGKFNEEECKPCVCQNSSLVTNCSTSKTNSTTNGQCPVGCVNSTMEKFNEEECKPCVCQNCSLATKCSKSKTNSTANGQCPVGCVNSTMRKLTDTELKSTGCADLYKKGERIDGVYSIDPDGLGAFDVRCDMTTNGGGWTTFQRRTDGSVDFYRGWDDYKKGFGNLNGEFWLGLDKIHRLSKSGQNVLRVDLEDFDNKTRYANYSTFAVANEADKYNLTVGNYSGNAGDSLSYHNRMKFSTKDMDNEQDKRNCAKKYKGAWWYNGCHDSNLNALYKRDHRSPDEDGLIWHGWRGYYYSLKRTEMKIRPRSF